MAAPQESWTDSESTRLEYFPEIGVAGTIAARLGPLAATQKPGRERVALPERRTSAAHIDVAM